MNSDAKFFSIVAVVAVIAIAAFFIFGKSNSSSSGNVSPADLTDAGQLVRPDSYSKGPEDAKVTVVEFADFQCPACKVADPEFDKIVAEYSDRARFVFRHFPLPIHEFAQLTAQAAEAAGEQGKFWEMGDKLYANQDTWANPANSEQAVIDQLVTYASELELNVDQFKQAITERKYNDILARDLADANALNINKTPTFLVNGADVDINGLRTAIDNGLK